MCGAGLTVFETFEVEFMSCLMVSSLLFCQLQSVLDDQGVRLLFRFGLEILTANLIWCL